MEGRICPFPHHKSLMLIITRTLLEVSSQEKRVHTNSGLMKFFGNEADEMKGKLGLDENKRKEDRSVS